MTDLELQQLRREKWRLDGNPIRTIEMLRLVRKDVRVVGFLSHVQVDIAAQAQKAGCDEVMPRSAFTQNLASILSVAKD